ncbi:hypothetical protein, partial [Cryobacterium sp. 5B3]|uniref:GH36-type glycosyl hydrolase domain-containing protein n=1 Tax=Cryobacterium sp. 5B3 TaxID=3048586 RepID=UPI002B231CB0
IYQGLRYAVHGLTLIGSCDWNDGMDKVCAVAKRERVWLGFFLYEVLMQFSVIAQQRGDQSFSYRCQLEAKKIQTNIEQHAW